MKRWPETLQASKLTNAPNGMKSASAALVGSSRNTVSPTAPTMRVTCQPKKSPPPSFGKCWHGSRHAANDGSGLESSDVQPPTKKTPHINNPATKSTPLFDGLPYQIHHRSTSRNTPVSRSNKLSAQTPQFKKLDAFKLSPSVGETCLGECSLL
jgi:hypothetical protein